jgi:hypothetical protein
LAAFKTPIQSDERYFFRLNVGSKVAEMGVFSPIVEIDEKDGITYLKLSF